jgi:Fe-S oxidoreductase
MSKLRKIKSIANLGKHFWLHVFRRLVRKPRPGEEMHKFLEYYSADKLTSLTCDDRTALFEYQKCINCGTCARVCPVYAPAAHGSYRAPDSIVAALSRSFPEFGAARDAVFNCTQCGACALECPRGIDAPGLIMLVRRKAADADGAVIRATFRDRLDTLEKHGSVHGAPAADFSAYKKQGAEYVFFTGCAGRTFAADETRKILELLRKLNVDFTMVDDACCGGFHRSAGLLRPDSPVALAAVRRILDSGATKVITACPHGLYTMRTHPAYKDKVHAQHVLELLDGMEFATAREHTTVTYHDPCFLGRRLGVCDAPRRMIARTGATLVEMPDARERTVCCGSQEGEFILDPAVAQAMAASRAAQAAATGAATLLTACPACRRDLAQAAPGLAVQTVCEYIADHYQP